MLLVSEEERRRSRTEHSVSRTSVMEVSYDGVGRNKEGRRLFDSFSI